VQKDMQNYRLTSSIKRSLLRLATNLPLNIKMLFRHYSILRFESTPEKRLEYIKKAIGPDCNNIIAFDLGANVGNFGNLLKSSYSGLYLVGYEANYALKDYFLYRSKYDRLYFKAVTKDGRGATLNIDGNSGFNKGSASSLVFKPKNMTGQVEVQSVSLIEVFCKEDLDKYSQVIVKMDIEGSEMDLLSDKFWDELRGKKVIALVEEHPFLFSENKVKTYKSKVKRFRKYIEKNGGVYIQWV